MLGCYLRAQLSAAPWEGTRQGTAPGITKELQLGHAEAKGSCQNAPSLSATMWIFVSNSIRSTIGSNCPYRLPWSLPLQLLPHTAMEGRGCSLHTPTASRAEEKEVFMQDITNCHFSELLQHRFVQSPWVPASLLD